MYEKPRIVFDGYNDEPSTKDATHLRRSCGVVGPTINFNPKMVCNATKEYFLGNPKNKQAFVQYLGDVLKKDGCQVLHAEGDADTLIVNTAVTCAVNVTTVVIKEDPCDRVSHCFRMLHISFHHTIASIHEVKVSQYILTELLTEKTKSLGLALS
ncbi:hypothetical protein ElyMa_004959500 [Elysia marginata]|uniref:Uncharacterized protein n=1 Tax=Elysia marginata TaxID=1093978 RepID=A0AAV4J5K7_9GAST|nr:hypothetical protein ElyMa_004959500 [Elysia marginata]